MAVDVGSAVGYLDLDISGFLAGLKSAQSEADKQSKNLATTIGSNISGMGKSITSVGTTLTKNVTVPLSAVSVLGLKVATDFEKGMSEVKAISGATGKDFDALRDKAIELGADTAFSAGEVAEAMTEMAKAGWSSQQIIDGMSGVLSAAAASGEGLATVSTIVADTITGFGMEAKESTRVADLLTQAANSGTIGITDLGESFKYIAPIAGSMGLSVEDVTTALSAMSMAGIKGSQAGTSLKTMLARMVKPTDQVAAAMDELGVSVTNQDGSMKSLDDIVSNLRTSFDGLTESEKAKYAVTLAGQEGMAGMLSLLNLTEEEYNAIAKSMDDAAGVAESTASVMQDNLQSKIEQLGGSLESLAIKLSDYVLPYLEKFVKWLTDLVDKFTELDPKTQKTILVIAGLAAALGPTIFAIGKLVTSIGGMITTFGKIPGAISTVKNTFTTLGNKLVNVKEAFDLSKAGFPALAGETSKLGTALAGSAGSASTFGGAIATVAGPVLAIVAVIAVLVAAFVSLWKNNEEFRDKITEIWDQVKATFERLTSGIVERINKLGFDFESIGEVIKSIWKGLCDYLAPIFEYAFKLIADVFDFVVDYILNLLDFWISIFTGDWEGAWEAIKGVFESIWNLISDFFSNWWNTFKQVWDVILGWFGTSWSQCWEGIKTFFINLWTNISTFFTNVWNSIVTWFQTALTNIATFFTNIWNGIKNTVTNIINNVKTTITNVFTAISTTVTNIWNNIKNAITTPFNAAKTTITNIVNSVKSIISNGFNAAKNTVANVFDSIKNKISSIMDGAKNIISTAINKIKGIFNFKWSLPKLKLPKISVTGGTAPYGIGGKGSLPKFSITWHKKAMNDGMIMNSPTIFGFDAKTNSFLGGGEAGSEVVVGTNSLLNMIRQTVVDAIRPMLSAAYQIAKASADLGYVTYNGFVKHSQTLEKIVASNNSGSGDTFIFNSPKAIDEIEAAKQMKRAKRDLAEGF